MAAGEEKLRAYQGVVGRVHAARDAVRERWAEWRARLCLPPTAASWPLLRDAPHRAHDHPHDDQDYSHIYRRKTRLELARVSAAVMGVEFSYAAETAFVSPTLLQMRVDHRVMTLAWAVSPLIGFFLTPVLGSLSDRCRLRFGRRRPFIVLLAAGVLLGLLLVPNGEALGHWLGDPQEGAGAGGSHRWGVLLTVAGAALLDFDADACQSPARAYLLDVTVPEDHARGLSAFTVMAGLGGCMGYALGAVDWDATAIGRALGGHVRAVFTLVTFIFTGCVLATVTSFRELPLELLERQARAPTSAQSRGEYEQLEEGECAAAAGAAAGAAGVAQALQAAQQQAEQRETSFCVAAPPPPPPPAAQVAVERAEAKAEETTAEETTAEEAKAEEAKAKEAEGEGAEGEGAAASPSLRQYLLSIVLMPPSLRILCVTNLFCWMAHVCYSLYFTDYVGEAVFGGNPKAEAQSPARLRYEEGVRFGCWGMAGYSLSCACYSLAIERLVERFGARRVYVGGLLVYACGMLLMAACRHRAAVLVFSWTAGVMYSTLFTMPYLLVARYHSLQTFAEGACGGGGGGPRGLGTDVAVVSSMVFLAQLLLSCGMGSVVSAAGSTTAVVACASALALCGAAAASRVMYLDL